MENKFLKISAGTLSRKFTAEETILPEFEVRDCVRVDAVKNEYECFQLVLSAKRDCFFTVEVSPFADGNGNGFPAGNVKVFNAKFLKMWHCLDYKGNLSGSYPDPLIPFKASERRKENVVKKGENAILVFEFNVPSTQKDGVYYGKITIFTPEPLEVNVSLNVLDICLPGGSEMRSLFFFNPSFASRFEKTEDFAKTYDKYLDFAIKHRVGSTTLTVKQDYSDEGIVAYVDRIYDYAKKGMPFTNIPTYPRTFLGSRECFDRQILIKFLIALANKCVSANENFLDKTGFYNWCIDEPFCLNPQGDLFNGYVENEIYAFSDCVNKAVKTLSAEEKFKTEFGKEVINSIKNFRQIVTDYYDFKPHFPNYVQAGKNGKPYRHDPKKLVLCPKFDGLDTEDHRKPYKGAEVWWYNCGEPNSPFPTYHLDESGYGPRSLAWMMRDYGVSGTLYWVCNNITELFDDGTSRYTDDPYKVLNGLGDNNEGLIVYPGHPYGIDGPIDSWRFVSIRDGQEDYELIGMLKKEYEKLGVDYSGIFRVITSLLYDNARINYFSDAFDGARKNLLTLMLLIKKGVAIAVFEGESNYSFTVKGNFDKAEVDGIVLFDGNYVINKQPKTLDMCITVDGETYALNLYAGAGLQVITDYELKDHASICGNVDVSYDMREVVYHTIIKIKDENGVTFKFKDDISGATAFSMSCLLKDSPEYEVISGGKVISEGRFVCEDAVYGTANRINLNPKDIVDNEFSIILEGSDVLGVREIYIYR